MDKVNVTQIDENSFRFENSLCSFTVSKEDADLMKEIVCNEYLVSEYPPKENIVKSTGFAPSDEVTKVYCVFLVNDKENMKEIIFCHHSKERCNEVFENYKDSLENSKEDLLKIKVEGDYRLEQGFVIQIGKLQGVAQSLIFDNSFEKRFSFVF